MDAVFDDLKDRVNTNGHGTVSMVWELHQATNLLRDPHVILPSIAPGSPLSDYDFYVYPERTLYSDIKTRYTFEYVENMNDGTMDLLLTVHWQDADGTETQNIVKSINNQTVYDFFLDMANRPVENFFNSAGARMNWLMTHSLRYSRVDVTALDSYKQYLFHGFSGMRGMTTRPSLWFPGTFVLGYDDGTSETYQTGVVIQLFSFADSGNMTTNVTFTADVAEAEAKLNFIGEAYAQFQRVKALLNGTLPPGETLSIPPGTKEATQSSHDSVLPHRRHSRRLTEAGNYTFDEVISLPRVFYIDAGDVAYRIEDDYAIMKIEGFDIYPEGSIELFSKTTSAAKARGVKKLIIDV